MCVQDYLPHRVEYTAVLVDPEQLVGSCDSVQVRLLSVEEVCIRFPETVEDLDAHSQFLHGAVEAEASVDPTLSEIAVQLVGLGIGEIHVFMSA